MLRAFWAIFYVVGFFGVALMIWRGLLSLSDTLEHCTRCRRRSR